MIKLSIKTKQHEELINITSQIVNLIEENTWTNGALMLFCPHTTCALTINEGADPDVKIDLINFFSKLIPHKNNWRHAEGNSDAHVKSSILGVSLLVPIYQNALQLGTWQSIYLYEGDGPRNRAIWAQYLKS